LNVREVKHTEMYAIFYYKKYTYFKVEDSIVRIDGRSLSRSK